MPRNFSTAVKRKQSKYAGNYVNSTAHKKKEISNSITFWKIGTVQRMTMKTAMKREYFAILFSF